MKFSTTGLCLLLAAPAFSAPAPTSDAQKAVLTLQGVAEGFLSVEVPDLSPCVSDMEPIFGELKEAMADLEKKTPESVLAGLKLLAQALQALKAGMAECKMAEGEIQKLEAALEQFKTPEAFAYHVGKDLLVNHKDIFAEVSAASTSWKAGQFEPCGESVGEALAKLIVGEDEETLVEQADDSVSEDALSMLKGVAEGFLKEEVPDMAPCLSGMKPVYAELQQAMQDLEQMTPASVLAGLKLLAESLQELKGALAECSVAAAEVHSLEIALEQFKSPSSFAMHVGKDLVMNHADIFAEVSAASTSWKSGAYEPCGVSVGEALGKLVVG